MNVKFYLDGKSDHKYIFMEIPFFNIRISTKQKVKPDKWDKKKQRPKGDHALTVLLDTLEKIAFDTIRINISKNIVTTRDHITAAINVNTSLFRNTAPKIYTFYDHALHLENTNNWRPAYLSQYRSWLNIFNNKYPNVTFAMMNYTFYKTYQSQALRVYNPNTFSGHWKKFKRVLDDATFSGYEVDQSYKKIKIKQKAVFKIFNTTEEIQLWYSKLDQLTDYLYNASCLYLIGCNSGMRYSDFKNVKSNIIYKDESIFYRVNTQKTHTTVTIPGNEMLNDLLTKDLHQISNQKMNQYLKEAAKIVGINTIVNTPTGPIPKYELIQTHTARRSFATNSVLAGIPIQFIMSITGHKTESEFRKYVKVDDIQNAIEFEKYSNK